MSFKNSNEFYNKWTLVDKTIFSNTNKEIISTAVSYQIIY